MKNILFLLQEKFKKACLNAFSELKSLSPSFPVEIAQSKQEKFGHYQFNSAMKLAKILGKNPRQIASSIIEMLSLETDEGKAMIANVEVAGPGFINITLATSYIQEQLNQLKQEKNLGFSKLKKQKKIVIDFSSPNVAKEMHVGHLRSTIIGDSLANLFEFLGFEVLRLNHIGDWGTSFGMLIAYLKEKHPDILSGKEKTDLTHLANWYKEARKKFKEDSSFKEKAKKEVVALQSGEAQAKKAWQIIYDISRKAYEEIYKLLNIRLVERGESYYNDMLPWVVSDLEKKGLATVSDGAKCIFLEGFTNVEGNPLPLIIQKADGGYLYATTDLAAIYHRFNEEKADRVIYVTDMGQQTHFQMIFKTAELAHYFDPKTQRVDHVPFGLVLGSDGKKFRTREGDTEKLIDLLTKAIDHAKAILQKRNPDLSPEEIEQSAHILGLGAVKYADLSCNRLSDYVFSYDRMLSLEGNTAAFLLYSYVRISGIKRHAKTQEIPEDVSIHLNHPSEIALALHLLRFKETLDQIVEDLMPNHLTEYLYQLANKFNAFYRDCKVLGSPEQDSRLLLADICSKVLKKGLNILGIKTLEKM